jgi:hypothetical protein
VTAQTTRAGASLSRIVAGHGIAWPEAPQKPRLCLWAGLGDGNENISRPGVLSGVSEKFLSAAIIFSIHIHAPAMLTDDGLCGTGCIGTKHAGPTFLGRVSARLHTNVIVRLSPSAIRLVARPGASIKLGVSFKLTLYHSIRFTHADGMTGPMQRRTERSYSCCCCAS